MTLIISIQTLSFDSFSEWNGFFWGYLVKGYELSGNELIYYELVNVVICSFPFYRMCYSPYFGALRLSL